MRNRYLVPGLLAAAAVLTAATPAWSQYLRIYYPDIEQGSSTLVVSPTGQALLIDGGTGIKTTDDAIESFISDLMELGIVTSLDAVIATHYDEDHIGRLENVFDTIPMAPTAVAYDRGEFFSTPTTFAYSDYVSRASQHNRTTITATTTLDLGGGVTVRSFVVNGDLPDGTTVDVTGSAQFENSACIAVVVTFGDFDVWIGGDLTGDISRGVTDVEGPVAPFVGDIDVYTFNHHGSETSSTQPFLTTLAAEVGINQNSASNNFGHPRAVVVNRFLATPDSNGQAPLYFQQNPGDPNDDRSDDTLASGIADCDDVSFATGQPGTITVLSDGTSYRISACAIPAVSLPADSGLGTIGDFPPAIRNVRRTPLVPLATEGVTVEAAIDDEGAVAAQVRWWLDGTEQAPIAMSAVGGGSYTATLPAQLDGTRVKLRVEATDGASQTELSRAQGYFSGVTPIATFRINDADGVLVPKEHGVRVQGNMTVEPGIFHPFVSQIYVQDASGGVQVFDGSQAAIQRGDLVEFVGELEQFAGQTEISIADKVGNVGFTVLGPGTPPDPLVVTVAQVGEVLEGRLIRIDNVTVVAGTIPEIGNGNLTITDDGGVSTLTLRVDGDTDIPGAETPTLPFDIIGIAGQFDTFLPLDGGYQITPRERADFLSQEVNLPPLLINEIHADPADGAAGDANGDGARSATADEFVELINTGFTSLDIGGWTLSDGVGLKHTFASGTVIPPREAVVVFGGGTPTGSFGNAAANGLVFTASGGSLSLNNAGDTVTVADDLGAVVQSVTYGAEGGNNQSLNRDPDVTNTPFQLHSQILASGGALYSPGTRLDGRAYTIPVGAVLLTEVMYDPTGADGGLEWFEIFNATGSPIDLGEMCVGNGGGDYTNSLVQLAGTLQPQATFVVGGPLSDANNANPVYDQVFDFSPDFQNAGTLGDGVALFNQSCARVNPATVPIDAVVYGPNNDNGLIDETGAANAPEVGDAPGGSSIERVDLAGAWQIQPAPTPNVFAEGSPPPPPPPGTGNLLLSEVFYDAASTDDGFEWVELYNSGTEAIDLSSFSLGNGGSDYTSSTVQLSGLLQPGATFVVGGPTSDATNGNPIFDLVVNFSPDFQNSGTIGDGVALFDVPASQITAATVPIDAVVYGPNNDNGLIDENGQVSPPEVGDAPAGSTIERIDLAGSWQIQGTPTPNSTPLSGGGGGGSPTTLHVSAIAVSTVNVGGGQKLGRAEVTIVDDQGGAVALAQVSGTFSGSYNETGAAGTDGSGVATVDTATSRKGGVSFTFCVDAVTHSSLTYDPGSNAVTCATF